MFSETNRPKPDSDMFSEISDTSIETGQRDPVRQAAVGAGADLAVGHLGDVDVGNVWALGLGDVELGDW